MQLTGISNSGNQLKLFTMERGTDEARVLSIFFIAVPDASFYQRNVL